MNPYMTEAELEEYLKLSRYTFWQLRRNGLPYRRIGRTVRYLPEEVEAWLNDNCQGQKQQGQSPKEVNNEHS